MNNGIAVAAGTVETCRTERAAHTRCESARRLHGHVTRMTSVRTAAEIAAKRTAIAVIGTVSVSVIVIVIVIVTGLEMVVGRGRNVVRGGRWKRRMGTKDGLAAARQRGEMIADRER